MKLGYSEMLFPASFFLFFLREENLQNSEGYKTPYKILLCPFAIHFTELNFLLKIVKIEISGGKFMALL